MNNAFKDKKDLIKISYDNSIYEEIKNCDCLISYSSTRRDVFNKPVMCYGLPNYNHLRCYEESRNKEKNQAS